MMTPVEHKVLRYSTELDPNPFQLQEFCRWIPRVEDMDRFIGLAIKEGLAGLFYKNLIKSDLLGLLNDGQREKLSFRYYRTVADNLRHIHAIKQLLPQFERRQVRVTLLKGIALVQQVYKDIGLRAMSDVDLWLSKNDYHTAVDLLITNHFRPDPHYPSTFRKKGVTIDLHTHILGADRIRHRTAMLKLTSEQIYQHARSIELDGIKALCLGPYDQIIYLCLHALKHNAEQLIWLVDIKHLTLSWRPSEWVQLHRRAHEVGQIKAVAAVFFLLKHLLAYHTPPDSPKSPTSPRLTHLEKKILKQKIKKGALPDWAPLIFFSSGAGFKNCCLLTIETLFPRPDILRQVFEDFPGLKAWQLYVMRFFQLIGRALALLIKN